MIPNYYIRIQEIPLTNNGKLDRRGLPDPWKEDILKEDYLPPESEIEKKICEIFSEVLGFSSNEIGKTTDFYEFGGDILNAIRVASRIEKELNIRINIKDILKYPVVLDLAILIENIRNNKEDSRLQVDIIERRNIKEFKITSQLMGIYLDSVKYSNSILYNVPYLLKLKKNTDVEKIEEAFNEIMRKQEILKSTYIKKK